MSQKAISIKKLAEFRNAHVSFIVGYAKGEGYYVMTAGQGFMRITLNGDQQTMITFLETALEGVRRGKDN